MLSIGTTTASGSSHSSALDMGSPTHLSVYLTVPGPESVFKRPRELRGSEAYMRRELATRHSVVGIPYSPPRRSLSVGAAMASLSFSQLPLLLPTAPTNIQDNGFRQQCCAINFPDDWDRANSPIDALSAPCGIRSAAPSPVGV